MPLGPRDIHVVLSPEERVIVSEILQELDHRLLSLFNGYDQVTITTTKLSDQVARAVTRAYDGIGWRMVLFHHLSTLSTVFTFVPPS